MYLVHKFTKATGTSHDLQTLEERCMNVRVACGPVKELVALQLHCSFTAAFVALHLLL